MTSDADFDPPDQGHQGQGADEHDARRDPLHEELLAQGLLPRCSAECVEDPADARDEIATEDPEPGTRDEGFTAAGVLSGYIAAEIGFAWYFFFTFVATIPSMVILPFAPHLDRREEGPERHERDPKPSPQSEA